MRPEVGRTEGVAAWAAGAPYCTVVCSRGHRKRLVERIKWAGPNGRGMHLYTAGARVNDPTELDPGTSAEDVPGNYETKWRLRCSCGLNVALSNALLDTVAEGLIRSGVSRIDLSDLAAMVSKHR